MCVRGMRRHIRCCTLHVKSGVGIPGQETTLGVPRWHGWEAGGSLLHTHRNPPPFGMVMGTCLPRLLPSWCEEAENAQDELRMHRHFTLLCKPSRADLQHQPAGLHGAERIRTDQASLELHFPCGVCLLEPPQLQAVLHQERSSRRHLGACSHLATGRSGALPAGHRTDSTS